MYNSTNFVNFNLNLLPNVFQQNSKIDLINNSLSALKEDLLLEKTSVCQLFFLWTFIFQLGLLLITSYLHDQFL